VAAPVIPPADNLIDDVSFNIGIILVVFTVFVLSLGAIAGALTMKRNGRREFSGQTGFPDLPPDVSDLTDHVLAAVHVMERLFG
jgi:hypothetical protein